MKAYILNIGDEVLYGRVINTNASYIASQLEVLGIELSKTIVVGDTPEDIKVVLNEFINSDAKLLITTGGLGPTHDDLTKETITEYLGLELLYNEKASQDMLSYFKQVKSDCNAKQAYYPKDSIIISNSIGSADGVIIPFKEKIIILLVGPHLEMKHLFEKAVIDYLKPFSNNKLIKDYILMGESESYFENILNPLIKKYPKINLAPYASWGSIRYRIVAKENDSLDFYNINDEFKALFSENIVSENNESIEEIIVSLLKKQKLIISCAESMTGGLIAGKITSVPGASEVFSNSFITYSNLAKIEILGIDKNFFKTNDPVSKACVLEMLKGLKKLSKSDVLFTISGYAGPSGIDVGAVWGAFLYKNKEFAKRFTFRGNREMIRQKASNYFLYEIYKLIKED